MCTRSEKIALIAACVLAAIALGIVRMIVPRLKIKETYNAPLRPESS